MNLTKSYEYFQPNNDDPIHIIGCGSVGSTIAENLARCGITKMIFWDFDTVESHNIVNQMFTSEQIGMPKVEALKQIICAINPEAEENIQLKPDGWHGKTLSGYIFLAVDSIDIRKQIVEKHFNNLNVKAVFDVRTLLESAQHYAADWSDIKMRNALLKSMQFTHEEAAEETPVSACGVTLGVATTVRLISALAVNNYINFVKGQGIWKFVNFDGFHGELLAI